MFLTWWTVWPVCPSSSPCSIPLQISPIGCLFGGLDGLWDEWIKEWMDLYLVAGMTSTATLSPVLCAVPGLYSKWMLIGWIGWDVGGLDGI